MSGRQGISRRRPRSRWREWRRASRRTAGRIEAGAGSTRLWRLARAGRLALDGEGARLHGGRYSSPGRPVVSLASEAGLAVLVTLRYAMAVAVGMEGEYFLGWTEAEAVPERIDAGMSREDTTRWVDAWLESRRSLLAAIQSTVLPEADVIFLNPLYPGAGDVPPLTVRQFWFSDCLHRPPALGQFP